MTTLGLAVAFAAGVEWRHLVVLAMAVHLPVITGALIGMVILWRSRANDLEAAVFCDVVAAELRAGASLKAAVSVALGSGGHLPAVSTIAEIARDAAHRFPEIGGELESSIVNGAHAGSQMGSVFDEIGSLAIAKAEARREVRMASAAGRATALVLTAAPTIFVMTQATSGALERYLETPHQRVAGFLGFILFVVGGGLAGWVTYEATR